MSNPVAFINGQFFPLNEARISIEDRGMQFGDSVYEVIIAINGRPFRLYDHLRRLERSLQETKIPMPYTFKEIEEIVKEALQRSNFKESMIYIQVTRGTAPREHMPPEGIEPNFILTVRKLKKPPEEAYLKGVRLLSVKDIRWLRCDIKTTLLLPNVLAKIEAREQGFYDALFVKEDGRITECTSSAFGLVKNNALYLPPLVPEVLPSITRAIIGEIASKQGIPVYERTIYYSELTDFDEAFLASTTQFIVPVIGVDDFSIGTGKPGPLVKKLLEEYRKLVKKETG